MSDKGSPEFDIEAFIFQTCVCDDVEEFIKCYNLVDINKYNYLAIAASNGSSNIAKYLIEKCRAPIAHDRYSAIRFAYKYGHVDLAKYMSLYDTTVKTH